MEVTEIYADEAEELEEKEREMWEVEGSEEEEEVVVVEGSLEL